jgi:hypothetical protein
MESTVWPAVLLVALLTLLNLLTLGATIFLALLHSRATTNQLQFLMQMQERNEQVLSEQSNQFSNLQQATLEHSFSRVSGFLSEALQSLSSQHQQSMTLVQKVTDSAVFGLSSSATEMANLTKAATTLLGTKDPLAYQMAMGAQSNLAQGDSLQPYTSTVADAEWEAQNAGNRVYADSALKLMTDFLGARDESDYPVPQ